MGAEVGHMEKNLSLGVSDGELTVQEKAPWAVFEAELPDDGRGIYKIYLTGSGGRFLLGTPQPEGGCLRLRRRVSLDELRRCGVWPPGGGEVRLAVPFTKSRWAAPPGWKWERESAKLLGDRPLRQAAEKLEVVYLRRESWGFTLAVPWRVGEAFPLPALFCFGRVEVLAGEECVLFSFTHRGCPHMEAAAQA